MEVSKLHQLKKKNLECILHIEMNNKFSYKIVRKIDVENVFLIN